MIFQTLKRPGHDVEPAIVECNDPSHHTAGGGVAVMPKSSGFGSTNGWTAIGVCTFLVVVFACTTLYYWQKAKKMAKDLFADNENANDVTDEDNDDRDLVPTPPPKPLSKKPCSLEDITAESDCKSSPKKDLLLNSTLLKSNSTLIKSPIMVDMMSNKCDR